jgi:hypothetical protein
MLVKRKRNEKRKEQKTLPVAQETPMTSLGPVFPPRGFLVASRRRSVILLLLVFVVFVIIPWLVRLVGGLHVVSLSSLLLVVASFLLSFPVVFIGWLPSRCCCCCCCCCCCQ